MALSSMAHAKTGSPQNESIIASNMTENPIPKEKISDCVTMLHTLDLVNTLSTHFVCKLCHTFMIDICTFPCGHMFCKYCALSSLRQQSSCPQCQQEAFKPFATRCYEIDSVIDDFYPFLWKFFQKLEQSTEMGRDLVKVVPLTRENLELESASPSRKSLDSHTIQLHSPGDRDKLRIRRRVVSERRDILLQAPCTSILQKLGTLGWGTGHDEQNIQYGMQTVVWLALCYALWNFLYVFHHPCFDSGLRTFVYSIVFLVAFNIIQRHLFVNPEQAPNLLDFELWEWTEEDFNENTLRNGDLEINVSSDSSAGVNASDGVGRRRSDNSDSSKSSSESFKDCEDGEGNVHQSLLELEQILNWKKEGSLDLEKMFEIASDMMNALGQMSTGDMQDSLTRLGETGSRDGNSNNNS